MSLMLFSYADVVEAASVAIDNATVSYGGSNQVVPDDLSNVDSNAVLVSFVADYVTYSDLVLVHSVTTDPATAGYLFGTNSINDPGSAEAAVTDNRLDSGIANAKTTAVFEFASPPSSLSDVFFLFDVGNDDSGVSIQLVDSSDQNIGTAVQMTSMAQLGSAEVESDPWPALDLYGVAIPLSDFGITAGQLSSVDGFKFTAATVDPVIAGIASPPSPDLELTTTNGTTGVSGALRINNSSGFGGSEWMVKNTGTSGTTTRKGYVRFDTLAIHRTVTNASLNLTISDNGTDFRGTSIHVYGITNQSLDSVALTNDLPWADGPANDTGSAYAADTNTAAVLLGNFQVSRGDTGDIVGTVKSFSNSDLAEFLNADTNNVVTFLLGRYKNNGDNGHNLRFAGDTTTIYAPPTLELYFAPPKGTLISIR